MYKSYSYNNMPQPINTFGNASAESKKGSVLPELSVSPPPKPTPAVQTDPIPVSVIDNDSENNRTIIGKLKADDMIILIVVALLLLNDCDDKLLLVSLAFIFFSDYFN
ncbi:MAG: hypothetical protein PUD92_04700 [Clostridiales bacterium]|nr:hypothetical protein [Clostridiales bacterium]